MQKLTVRLFNDEAQGALPTLYAATADVPSGSYVAPDGFRNLRGYPKLLEPPEAARDADVARQLWSCRPASLVPAPTCRSAPNRSRPLCLVEHRHMWSRARPGRGGRTREVGGVVRRLAEAGTGRSLPRRWWRMVR